MKKYLVPLSIIVLLVAVALPVLAWDAPVFPAPEAEGCSAAFWSKNFKNDLGLIEGEEADFGLIFNGETSGDTMWDVMTSKDKGGQAALMKQAATGYINLHNVAYGLDLAGLDDYYDTGINGDKFTLKAVTENLKVFNEPVCGTYDVSNNWEKYTCLTEKEVPACPVPKPGK